MKERLEQVEIKVAYLEQANAELGDMVYRQKLEIDSLRQQMAVLLGRIEAAQAQATAYTAEEEKPPHY
jgi:uncharacterized coiled-coil protein SlyX